MSSENLNKSKCIICLEESKYVGYYDCSHWVCGRCGIKMVHLFKDLKCSQCNRMSDKIVISKNNSTKYSQESAIKYLFYTNQEIGKYINDLITIRCKICDNKSNETYTSYSNLYKHLKKHENTYACKTCLLREFELWDEITVYKKYEEFKVHRSLEHVFCIFCNIWCFDNKEAKMHCSKKHHVCTVCHILGKIHVYFEDYPSLERHFKSEHYCCTEELCIKSHCYAFAHKSELWAHCFKIHNIKKDLEEFKLKKYLGIEKRMDLDKNEVSEVSSKQLEKLLKNIDVKPRLLNPVIGNQNGINFKSESNLNMKMVENLTKNIVEMQRQRISSVGLTETSKVVQNNYNNIEKTRNELEELFGGLFPNAEKTDRMMMVYSLLSVLYRSKETSFLAKYLEEIKYTKFEVKETKKEELPVRKKMFKVFDLSKLKKK